MILRAAALATTLAAAAVPAWAQSPDVALGRDLARQWCASCHQVAADGAINEVAPSFLDIANDPERTLERLRTWLSSDHPQMPDFNLGHREIAALIAYLESLRQP